MNSSRTERVLIVVGIGAVSFGIVVMAVPSVAAFIGGTEVLVSLLGLVALVQMARTASDFWNVPRSNADLPNAHTVDSAIVVSETFDHTFELSSRRGSAGRRNREQIKRYVRQTAVRILVAETGDSSDTIQTQLDDGTWTDDPIAAALFTDEPVATWRDQIRSLLSRETTFQRRVQHAVAALERRVEENTDG